MSNATFSNSNSFCIKHHEKAKETYEQLKKAHGDQALFCAQVFQWHKEFLEGQVRAEDEPCSRRLVTVRMDENVERVRALIKSDRLLTARMLGDELNMSH